MWLSSFYFVTPIFSFVLHMVFTSPFRSRSYERLKEDESNATVASSSSSIKSPEPSSSVSRVEEKTPKTNKIAFPEHEDDSMRTPSPEEQPSSSSKSNNSNTNANGRKVLGEMTNDVSMTPLSAKLKNLKYVFIHFWQTNSDCAFVPLSHFYKQI